MLFSDEHEVENGVEEGLLHKVEADDSKGSVTAVGAATMTPSPALLWRFKVLNLLCLLESVRSFVLVLINNL